MAGKTSQIANLEAKGLETPSELAAVEAAFASAVHSMEAPPIELSDDQIGDLVGIKNLAEVRLVKARAAHRRADHALTEAKTAAAEKERKDNLTRVHSLGAAAQKQMQEAVTTAIKQLRAAMRAMAEAEIESRNSEPATSGRSADPQLPSRNHGHARRAAERTFPSARATLAAAWWPAL
ncbi:hypothetical protein QA649_04615 [Bradyrhizobium sp. CB1717]|uniref:hypothetical protein n=1 Tax=Bradyrhizobium sp. CB1717 TaxID=3039154 RepID=UPI0024B13FF4|nr:hypothetical protein [Bradyrhizobium sp. CB1717]WFU25523.1 hypothetical protein QA649_04615 [Bradyrhizobium sp. CB1717]